MMSARMVVPPKVIQREKEKAFLINVWKSLQKFVDGSDLKSKEHHHVFVDNLHRCLCENQWDAVEPGALVLWLVVLIYTVKRLYKHTQMT